MSRDVDILLGDPKKALLVMAVPLIVSYLTSQVNSFADASWCSGLGIEASSAITTISPVYWIMTSIGMGLSVAAMSTISFCIGSNENLKANRLASQAIVICMIASILISIIMYLLLDPIIDLIGAQDVRDLSKEYIKPFLIMSWASITSTVIAGIIRAEGAAKKSMMVLISAVAFNMVLDPILIYTMGMGVAGAGWATCISAFLAMALGLSWYVRDSMFIKINLKNLRLRKKDVGELMNIALPRTAESTISNVSDMLQRIFIIFVAGTMGVAMYSLAWRYIALAVIPATAISSALITVCSASFGQRDFKKAKIGMDYALKLAVAICVCLAMLIFMFADQLVILMTYSESMIDLRPILAWSLRAYCIIIPFYALISLGSSILQTVRMSKKATIAVLLINMLKLSLMGIGCMYSFEAIFYALIISNTMGGVLMITWAYAEVRRYGRAHIHPPELGTRT